MPRTTRYSAAQALKLIWNTDEDSTISNEEEEENIAHGAVNEEEQENLFDDDQDGDAATGDSEVDDRDEGDIPVFVDDGSDSDSETLDEDTVDQVVVNNIAYSRNPFQSRRRNRNIVERRNQIAHPQSALEAFNLSEGIIREVLRCTNRKVTDIRRSVTRITGYMNHFTYDEICACLGILLRAGLDRDNFTSLPELWNPKEGRPFYRAVTSLNRMQFFLRCIRFDNFRNRAERQVVNRLAAISDVWDQFVSNLRRPYSPGDTLAVDEQLLGYRGCIPGRTYLTV